MPPIHFLPELEKEISLDHPIQEKSAKKNKNEEESDSQPEDDEDD